MSLRCGECGKAVPLKSTRTSAPGGPERLVVVPASGYWQGPPEWAADYKPFRVTAFCGPACANARRARGEGEAA